MIESLEAGRWNDRKRLDRLLGPPRGTQIRFSSRWYEANLRRLGVRSFAPRKRSRGGSQQPGAATASAGILGPFQAYLQSSGRQKDSRGVDPHAEPGRNLGFGERGIRVKARKMRIADKQRRGYKKRKCQQASFTGPRKAGRNFR